MTRRLFDHTFDIAFALRSADGDARDVTPAMLRRAILRRLAGLSDHELVEAVGPPFDTTEIYDSTG